MVGRGRAVRALAALLVVALGACSWAASPSPSVDPLQALVADLTAAGLSAHEAGSFTTDPVGGQGTIVCAGSESLQVYEFGSVAARETAAATIDRQDPSHIGNAIVDWVGQPHFWQRDRLIVLSVGGSSSLVIGLNVVLGRPFAEGPSAGMQPSPNACAGS